MFLVEGGMSFDTRNAVAGARAFQRELKNTSKFAQDASRAGIDLEDNFSRLGSQKTRSALRGLQSALMGAKDGTDAAIAGAKALQIALVKSVAGTAIIGGVGVLSDSIRDVGSKIGAASDEASRAMKNFQGFATSLEDGAKRSDALTQSADNTLKALEGLKNAGIFQAGVFKLFGGERVLEDLEEATRGLAQEEFRGGAAAERRTAERRMGMTPDQISADRRREEEQKRLREARSRGGPAAEADVAATIALENRQAEIAKGAEAQKKFDKDVADAKAKIDQAQKTADKEKEKARLDALAPAARIVEIDKEAARVTEEIAKINKEGIYGTEEKRKAQLEMLISLNEKMLELENKKAGAIKEQADEEERAKRAKAADEARARDIGLEEVQRKRNLERSRREARSEMRRSVESQQRSRMEEELRKFFGSGSWQSIPENIRNQMLISGVSNQHLSLISRNTAPVGGGGGAFQQRAKSGPGMERPPGYVPPPSGVDRLFSEDRGGLWGGQIMSGSRGAGSVMRGKPSAISATNPYRRTKIRGESGGMSPGDLAKAIQSLADKIPSAVPQ